jgi:septal ring factor EnvC (AmiA/AmiB activator)
MNARLLLISLLLASGSQAFAAQEPAAGKSTLKLSQPESATRSARKELAAIEQDLKSLDTRIVESKNQALTAKATQGSNSQQAASMQALAAALEAQRAQLVAKRGELQAELNATAK